MNQKRQEEKEGKKVEHRKSIMPGDDIIGMILFLVYLFSVDIFYRNDHLHSNSKRYVNYMT